MCINCKEGLAVRRMVDRTETVENLYLSFGICEPCHESCLTCSRPDSAAHCTSCPKDFENNTTSDEREDERTGESIGR